MLVDITGFDIKQSRLRSPTKKSLDPLFSQYTPRKTQDGVLGQATSPALDSVCGISKGARSSVDAIITNVAATPGSSTEFYDKGSFSVPNSALADADPTSIPAGTNLVYRRGNHFWAFFLVFTTLSGMDHLLEKLLEAGLTQVVTSSTANVDIIHNGERYQVDQSKTLTQTGLLIILLALTFSQ